MAVLAFACSKDVISARQEHAIITLIPDITHQTFAGWEATASIGEIYFKDEFLKWRDEVIELNANDLGINRIRLGYYASIENNVDYFSQYFTGQITYDQWREHREQIVNDNNDPDLINSERFHFSLLDLRIDNIVLPLKQLVEANGEKLYINIQYVGADSPDTLHCKNPEEYAELMLAIFQHINSKYGWIPDAVEIVNEPKKCWDKTKVGPALAAAGKKLKANGFTPDFVAPSAVTLPKAIKYFDEMIQVPGILDYWTEFSYHGYGGYDDTNRQAIADRAEKYGLDTSQLEQFDGNGTYETLHHDLKIAGVSAWQQYVVAYPTEDNGAQYYTIDISNKNNPKVSIGALTKFLRQYFKFIRKGAVRIEAITNTDNFDPVAFINRDGKYVVVIKAETGGSFYIQGLQTGTYGVKYTTASQYDVDVPDVTVGCGKAIKANIPMRGVLTVYGKSSLL